MCLHIYIHVDLWIDKIEALLNLHVPEIHNIPAL